jgi:hypothetical protein
MTHMDSLETEGGSCQASIREAAETTLSTSPLGLAVAVMSSASLLGQVRVVIFPVPVFGLVFASTVVQALGVLQLTSGRASLMLC